MLHIAKEMNLHRNYNRINVMKNFNICISDIEYFIFPLYWGLKWVRAGIIKYGTALLHTICEKICDKAVLTMWKATVFKGLYQLEWIICYCTFFYVRLCIKCIITQQNQASYFSVHSNLLASGCQGSLCCVGPLAGIQSVKKGFKHLILSHNNAK